MRPLRPPRGSASATSSTHSILLRIQPCGRYGRSSALTVGFWLHTAVSLFSLQTWAARPRGRTAPGARAKRSHPRRTGCPAFLQLAAPPSALLASVR